MLLTRSYSHHSLLSAVPKIPALVEYARKQGYTTIALTDEETGSGFVEFYDYCKNNDIKAALGVTMRVANLHAADVMFGRSNGFCKVALIAKNEQGYKDLLELISLARTIQEEPVSHLKLADISAHMQESSNMFVVLAGNDHELITSLRSGRTDKASEILDIYLKHFDNTSLIVELANHQNGDTQESLRVINQELISLCKAKSVKYVASPAPRYLNKDDEEVFKIVLAVRDGKRARDIQLERECHLPSITELQEIYDYAPEALDTKDIESQIDIKIRTDFDKNANEAYFPKFHLDEGQEAPQRLIWETYIGLVVRLAPEKKTKSEWKDVYPYNDIDNLKSYTASIDPSKSERLTGYSDTYWQEKSMQDYIDRAEMELDVIISKGYADYFLVFGDLMTFCRENGIVTNTRGSAAGSLVGYLNNINILDPLVYNVPFERFLNPLRPSPPDIDGDFADDKRDLVIRYITEKYGETQVCQIITFGTMLPRAAVRDVGRALGISYKKCDRLSKLIPIAPQGRKTTFKWAKETSVEFAQVCDQDEEAGRIVAIAEKIEGNYRHASSHAAGVIISPTKTTDYAPLQWDSDHKMIICQYDMRTAEKVGLVKMDILGIRNLAILGNAISIAKNRRTDEIDLLNIDLFDRKAFDLLAKGRTMGTFQLSGPAMTRYLVDLEPTKVEDLMAMVALYRPGPMASIPEYIKRKRDPKLVDYLVPQMEKWMEPSYGIFVYQEDLLMTAIELAGYDWGQADVLRKGMGKKIQAVIDEQHPKFVEGCVQNSGLSRDKAEEIWSLMVPFGAYGFNKAHSCSYGMVAYWTAYMKAEYTVEFMTSLMTAEASNLDKIAAAIKECKDLGIKVLPPDVNASYDNFSIDNDTTIRYGLSSVKNLGSDVIRYMIEEREKSGPFNSLEDFLERMSGHNGFTKRSLEALILAGCLDELGGASLIKLGLM